MGGPVAVAVPVLDTAVGVRVPTTRLGGAVQIMAAVHYGSRGGSDTVVTTRVTDWPADQHCIISQRESSLTCRHSPCISRSCSPLENKG